MTWPTKAAKEIEADYKHGRQAEQRIKDRAAIIAKHAPVEAEVKDLRRMLAGDNEGALLISDLTENWQELQRENDRLRKALGDGLDLCVRARALDAMEVDQTSITRSGTIPLWMDEQYQKDLAAWEEKARALLPRLKQKDTIICFKNSDGKPLPTPPTSEPEGA